MGGGEETMMIGIWLVKVSKTELFDKRTNDVTI